MKNEPVKLNKAASALDALKPKDKMPKGAMAIVDALYDKIAAAIGKGYTYDEISKLLEEHGCKIKPSTLRQYYGEKKRKVSETATPNGAAVDVAGEAAADKKPAAEVI